MFVLQKHGSGGSLGETVGMALAKTTNPITALMRTFGIREGGSVQITTSAGKLTVNGLNYEYMPNDGSSKRVAPNGINDSAKSAVLLRVIRRIDPEIDALIAH